MKFYEKVCPVCNKIFKGTKMREICSDKCLHIRRKQLVKVTCKDCGKVDIVPKYYCNRCTECHSLHERIRKAQKRSSEKAQLNTWEQYAKWHKANPDKSYGDYQIEKRKASGELLWK